LYLIKNVSVHFFVSKKNVSIIIVTLVLLFFFLCVFLDKVVNTTKTLRPCPMVLNCHVECTLQQMKMLQWMCWKRVWKRERMKPFNKFNLTTQGHVSRIRWPKTARAVHAETGARESAGGGERNRIVDTWGHVFDSDWLFGFLSF